MIYLLTKPNNFTVNYKINEWMEPEKFGNSDWAKAQNEHQNLVSVLGDKAEVLDSVALPDFVFTANHAVVYNGKALLSHFSNPERQKEEAYIQRMFGCLNWDGYLDAVLPWPSHDLYFEGAGDCIWDEKRKVFWMGHGPRTSLESRELVAKLFGVNVLPLELKYPWYHLDLVFCVLPGGEVMYYPGGLTQKSQELLEWLVLPDDRIILTKEDAEKFAANSISFDKEIIMSDRVSNELIKTLKRGYYLRYMNLDSFKKAGGGAACLALNLDVGKSNDEWKLHISR